MSNFTYQYGEKNCKNEYYEWDNLWWDNVPDRNVERVLIIGDSISCGYRRKTTKIADGKYFVDGLGTSKALDDPAFIPLVDYVLAQEDNLRIIQVNHGLHGWHLNDETEYKEYFIKLIEHLLEKRPDSKLVIALTTPTRNLNNLEEYGEEIERVKARNKSALEIAEKFNLPVNDLYSVVINSPELYSKDGVHLNDEGYMLLAQQTHEIISDLMNL